MYFKLRDHIYEVTSSVVRLLCDPWEDTFGMDIDIYAESKDEALDHEMRELRLYHNNGFETGESHYLALKGKKYIWTSKFNELGEEADTGCEHRNDSYALDGQCRCGLE